tara:strand:+ start:1358 stop:1648 length:291 start_codon:yes stop_codon:yes gene_type:complete
MILFGVREEFVGIKNINNIVEKMRTTPKGIRFVDLVKVCDHYFGESRQSGTSHRIYKTPWPGDPRVNIQNNAGKAKAYQVKQVLLAINKLDEENNV